MKPMKGKTVVVTGPTSGIGKEIAIGLAKLGADLVLGCRDTARGKEVAAEIERGRQGGSVEIAAVDVSSRKSIEQ
ncbi:MAG TPA: SDR family NAD(P)-dependent oxidoreductase, partial [Spirochaetia bacterium]|nr:SDR family NAD(P)-dependent oxidoreductase [Spirochaetia bacterium]